MASFYPHLTLLQVELKSEPTCLTEEEAQKQEQEEQIQQISLQLQEQLEQHSAQQSAQALALPDTIDTEMDIVLDSKDQNFLNAF